MANNELIYATYFVGTFNVDFDDQIPVFILHVLEADVPQDARIIDQYIDSSKVLYGCLNYALAIDHIVVVCHGFSAGSSNLIDNDISSLDESGHMLA